MRYYSCISKGLEMFGFNNSSEKLADRLLEEKLYEEVAQDLDRGKRREGIWAKALANSNGSESQAQSLYIKYHVQALKDELQLQNETNQEATQNKPKETQKTRDDYSSDEAYIKAMIVQNTKNKENTFFKKTTKLSNEPLSIIKNFIMGSIVFVISTFVGMIVGDLFLNRFNPDLVASGFASAAFLGWSFGFASLYFYLKKEWLKYPVFIAFASFIISLIN